MQFVTYTRVSTQEQGQSRNGLEGQERAIQAFISSGGHSVLASFSEVVSGKLWPVARPVLRQALELVESTGATLLVSRLDRLSRSVEFIASLMNRSIRFATVEDGLEVEPMMLHLKATFAEQERRLISERTKAGLASTKARGTVLGFASHKTAGSMDRAHTAAAVVNRAKATAFADTIAPTIHDLKRSKLTYQQIADHLNRLNIKTERNGKWHASTVSNTLKRATSV